MKCNSSTYYSIHNLQYNIYLASKQKETTKIVEYFLYYIKIENYNLQKMGIYSYSLLTYR